MIRVASILFLLLAGFVLRAGAHPVFQSPLWVAHGEKEVTVKAHVSAKEICTAAGIPIDKDGRAETELIVEAAPKHEGYFFKHFTVSADGKTLQGKVSKITPPEKWEISWDGMDRNFFIFEIRYPCDPPPKRISLWQNMMGEFPYTPGTPFNFSYMVRFGPEGVGATDFGPLAANGAFDFDTGRGGASAASSEPTRSERTAWNRFRDFLQDGVMHVLTGYDHLLFAAALVLALRSFWEIFKIIGVFTLAHSITVTLSAYQLLKLPGWFPVEPLISASIVVVALDNILFPNSTHGWRRTIITFIFGLVHGMGLAGAFVENLQGFPVGMIAWAVIGFCVGVELGHLAIVGPLSMAMAAGRSIGREPFSRRALRWGSVFVALGGIYFFANSMQWLPESITPDKVFGAH